MEETKNEKQVILNNEKVTISEFSEKLKNLKSSQKIVETGKDNYYLIERLYD